MPRRDRLRRVVIVCCLFARNLAYYLVGRTQEYLHYWTPSWNASANFWRATNANFIVICVLEWCKLFADKQGKHYWKKIVTDAESFEAPGGITKWNHCYSANNEQPRRWDAACGR
jgi:hypothetical protein